MAETEQGPSKKPRTDEAGLKFGSALTRAVAALDGRVT
jgi:hypothetical protein